ncbi:MAG: 4-hydroxythreonine-4-phosphate dehydrogenase PdxA [Pseudomonadota bacterium]
MIPPLALTMGDPGGIGPEITGAAWAALQGGPRFYVIADPDLIRARCGRIPVAEIADPADTDPGALSVLPLRLAAPAEPGRAVPQNAAATIRSIELAVAQAQTGKAAAVVTNPITKKVLVDGAGFGFPGHTEFLAHLGGGAAPLMMLAAPELRVVPATIHIPLAAVPAAVTGPLITRTLEILHAALRRDFGLAAPRIAVAGLNPHAGEGGLMGQEDGAVIAPALQAARDAGMDVTGPLPADTMFHAAARARYDAAVCMYHDQALIPLKTLNFSAGVNVTLGLPFVRTSPDHGTAYDIAGTGAADPDSLIAAIRMAAEIATRRRGQA